MEELDNLECDRLRNYIGTDCTIAEPSPSLHKENKIREIHITQLNRGYVVEVGCHKFAISTTEELIDKLTKYIREPNITEDKWFKGNLF